MMKLQYRLMVSGANSWGEWQDFIASVSTIRADYFEVRQVRDYRKGSS